MSIYLIEATTYDPDVPGTVTNRWGTVGLNTATLAFDARLKDGGFLKRQILADRVSGRGEVSVGDIVVANDDGDLDDLEDHGVAGHAVTVWRGEVGDTFPDDYREVFVARMEQVTFQRSKNESTMTIRLRSRMVDAEIPLQATKYDGDNDLPDGLEGVDDLEGKPLPWLFGDVFNVPAVIVNTSRLIDQYHDAALQSITAVRNRGVAIHMNINDMEEITAGPGTSTLVLAYGGGFYIAGKSNSLYNSTDGDTFTSRDTTTFTQVMASAFGNGVFVVTGTLGQIATSTDGGANYTGRTSGFGGTDQIRDVAYGPDYFVAVGDGGGTSKSNADATSWSFNASGATGPFLRVAYGNGIWVAIGTTEIYTSTDGASWTSRTKPTTSNMQSIGFGNGIFVLTSNGGEIMTSIDGLSWTDRFSPTTSAIHDPYFTPGVGWIAPSAGNVRLLVSPDGANWTNIQPPSTAYGATSRVASNGSQVLISTTTTPTQGIIKTADIASYASAADLEDDSLIPLSGSVKQFLDSTGSYLRHGASPGGQVTIDALQGAAAANRTAGELFGAALREGGFTGLLESDLTAPTRAASDFTGTATKATVSDPWGGSPGTAISAEDDDGAAVEELSANAWDTADSIADGVKVCVFVIRENTDVAMPASGHDLRLHDVDAAADRLVLNVSAFVNGKPTVSATTGTLLELVYVGNGYWAIYAETTSVTGANEHDWELYPAVTTAHVGKFDFWKAFVYEVSAATWQTHDWLHIDLAMIAIARPEVVGYYAGSDDKPTVVDVLDVAARSSTSNWFTDHLGRFRLKMIVEPSDVSSRMSFVEEDMVEHLQLLEQRKDPVPCYRSTIRYRKNYTVQREVAAQVGDAKRALYEKEWREVNNTDATVQTKHPNAPEDIHETGLVTLADATTVAALKQSLFGVDRKVYEFAVGLDDDTIELELGQEIDITHSRFGLSSGKNVLVRMLDVDTDKNLVRIGAWG